MPEATTRSSPFQTILVATDFSTPAHQAFAVACSLARGGAARLIALHVEEPFAFGELDVPVYVPGECLPDPALLLSQLRQAYPPVDSIAVDYRVEQGHAAEGILRTAEEAGCDLVVMGTNGRTGLDRLRMGSVAEAVMRRARCACLAVGPSPVPRPEAGPLLTILHPTDFSHHSEAALRVARSLARDHGACLVLLHVVPPETLPAAVSEVLMDLEIGREGLDAARRGAEGPDLKCPVKAQLRRGEPAATIVEAAAGLDCDLIVIGSHGRTALGRLLMGSVAEATLRRAPCPVLVVKASLPAAPHTRSVVVPMLV